MSAQIFISHASRDRRVARSLCNALEYRGLDCWIANRDVAPGENFQAAIVRAIRRSKVMLLVFTNNANNSDEIKKELALASQSKLLVIPLRVEDVLPEDAFAFELVTRQWVDMFDDWELSIERLLDRITVVLPAAPRGGEQAASAELPAASADAADLGRRAPEGEQGGNRPRRAPPRWSMAVIALGVLLGLGSALAIHWRDGHDEAAISRSREGGPQAARTALAPGQPADFVGAGAAQQADDRQAAAAANAEADRKAAAVAKAEADRKAAAAAKAEADRKAAAAAKAEADRKAAAVAKAEADRKAAAVAKAEADRKTAAAAKAEADRKAATAARRDAQRAAAEAAKQEADRRAAEAARQEAERKVAEAVKQEADREAAVAARQEADREAAEAAKRAAERQAADAIRKQAIANRQAALLLAWGQWQSRMQIDFDRTASLGGTLAAQRSAWELFMQRWRDKNAFSDQDQRLRAEVTRRLAGLQQ